MPWENKTVEDIREEFVHYAKASGNISLACREFGITRKTGYKWLERYTNNEDLKDRSRKPNKASNRTDIETERLILDMREENPGWGGKTIHDVLARQGYQGLPCAKTCNNILKRYGWITSEESMKHTPYVRFAREHCNELWQTDFKGDFLMRDGTRCFPLDILDDCSRFSILIEAKANTLGVTASFRQAFLEYGMPLAVLSDNGAQFAGFKGGYTSFEKWLMNHDILPMHGRIMHPQTQGKIERFHRTMKQELLNHRQFDNLAHAQKELSEWREKYNNIRPHSALGSLPPAEIYTPSSREYHDDIRKFEYEGYTRKVNAKGYLRFAHWQSYLSETMADEIVRIAESDAGDSFNIFYRNFKIAEVDAHNGRLLNRKISRR